MELLAVHKPGRWVKIGDDVPATVKQVSLTEGGHSYEVVWWDGRTRYSAWIAPHEIRGAADPDELRIGFCEPCSMANR